VAPVFNPRQRAASLGVATLGIALGLGGGWRLPALLDRHGTAAFLLAYLGAMLTLGLPMLMAEQLIGRRGRANPVVSLDRVARAEARTCNWRWFASIGGLAGLLLLAVASELGAEAALHFLHRSPSHLSVITMQLGLCGLAGVLVSWDAEARARTQSAALVVALALLGTVLVLAGRDAAVSEAMARWDQVDLSSLGWDGLGEAVRLALLTLGLSLGTVMGQGASLPAGKSILRASATHLLLTSATLGLILLLVGMTLVPYQIPPLDGTALVLGQLPAVLADSPGRVVWYGFIVVATLIAALGVLESVSDQIGGRTRIKRRHAALLTAGVAWMLGAAGNLAGYAGGVMGTFRMLAADFLIPLAALGLALFAGWAISRRTTRTELGLPRPVIFLAWRAAVRYLAPLALTGVLAQSLAHILAG
jgi:NSS family neurotransmitter:Na+ symporter